MKKTLEESIKDLADELRTAADRLDVSVDRAHVLLTIARRLDNLLAEDEDE